MSRSPSSPALVPQEPPAVLRRSVLGLRQQEGSSGDRSQEDVRPPATPPDRSPLKKKLRPSEGSVGRTPSSGAEGGARRLPLVLAGGRHLTVEVRCCKNILVPLVVNPEIYFYYYLP
uniref:Uncharacterized protein n=1 Tax=Plectus sambesii TaxID=2011161 RepID=A0A914X7A5_9BILA